MPAAPVILFNKPYRVLSQFRDRQTPTRSTLADYIDIADVYPAGRLDYDSEGLLILTSSGELQSRISHPRNKLAKYYWVQVEGCASEGQMNTLASGVDLSDGLTRPAKVQPLPSPPRLWPRQPAVIAHRNDRSSWLEVVLTEGKNRQVRRMCAAVGLPVLRLVRHRIGHWQLDQLQPGEYRRANINLPESSARPRKSARNRRKIPLRR